VGLAGVVLAPSCHSIDAERKAPPRATLGDDIYGAVCDRLGAGVLTEDLAGASYQRICHFDEEGRYGDTVDVSALPAVKGEKAKRARALAVAKLERLATRRRDLIRAINHAFPDVAIADAAAEDPKATVRLHDALLRFSQDLTRLYEENIIEPGTTPSMELVTGAFGRLFGALENNDAARAALMRIAGRQGYRPLRAGLGAIRMLLAYPELGRMLDAELAVLGSKGAALPALRKLLTVVKGELLSARPVVSSLGAVTVSPQIFQPSRPRSALEVARALLLAEHESFAPLSSAPPLYITHRDARGFAIPLGSTPGVAGSVPAPFADQNGDGFADVDALGRFLDATGAPLELTAPFVLPGSGAPAPVAADAFGRPLEPTFQYLDTSRTLAGALARDLVALVDPTKYAPEGAAEPWLEEHETLLYALAGTYVLAGAREQALFDHTAEESVPAGTLCPIATEPNPITGKVLACTPYERFVGEASPLADLVHAAGQVVADPDSDAIFASLEKLFGEYEPVVARLIGAALRIKAIADEHDALAAQGLEEKAALAYEVPVWDEVAQIVGKMAQKPGLVGRLVTALADPAIVSSHPQDALIPDPPSSHMGETVSAYMRFVDQYTYDPESINGPPINLSDGGSLKNPHVPVDRTQPLRGDNRSMMERSLQAIYDAAHNRACTKEGAKVYSKVGNLELYYPPFGAGYAECELMSFEDAGAFYLDTTLPDGHPKRAKLDIKPADVQELLKLVGNVMSIDALLEQSSGIAGLTLHPTPEAINRMMFFGAQSVVYGKLADYDAKNAGSPTAKFLEASLEPVSPPVCPKQANGTFKCATSATEDLMRLRDRGSVFAWERLGFYQYLRPQLRAFAETGCDAAVTSCTAENYEGESFFLDLMGVLWRHWPGKDAGPYCDLSVPRTHPRHCSGAGINRYEPILAEAFLTDFIPALHELAVVIAKEHVVVARGPKAGQKLTGPEAIELMVRILFDQSYAAKMGIADRFGKAAAAWVDGTPQAQHTVFTLFADALHAMDRAFETSSVPDAAARRSKWKRARSALVDRFLAVESEGSAARFANRATARAVVTALRLFREQTNANCPDRDSTGACAWARKELGHKLAATLSRPVFAAVTDLTEALMADEPARRELERMLSWALLDQGSEDVLHALLASLSDLMQLLTADGDFAPIFNAVARAVAAPVGDDEAPGCADRTLQVLEALRRIDRHRVLDHVMPRLVEPIDGGQGLSPLEIFLDAIADVNRTDASLGSPLDERDYRYVFRTLRELMTSETRGFEQLYYIVRHRKRE
jgi:PAS domain-containing protein